jgi:hypothetical protein
MAKSAMTSLWAPGVVGDLVLTDPTRSPLLQFSARHTPAIASSQTPSEVLTHLADAEGCEVGEDLSAGRGGVVEQGQEEVVGADANSGGG